MKAWLLKLLAGVLGNWEFIAAAVLAFGLYSAGIAWRAHHVGWDGGVASMQTKLDKSNTQIGALTQQRDDALGAVAQVKHQLEENSAAAAAAAAQAQVQVTAAEKAKSESDRIFHQWMDRYAKALRSPDCHAAMEQICPALQDY